MIGRLLFRGHCSSNCMSLGSCISDISLGAMHQHYFGGLAVFFRVFVPSLEVRVGPCLATKHCRNNNCQWPAKVEKSHGAEALSGPFIPFS